MRSARIRFCALLLAAAIGLGAASRARAAASPWVGDRHAAARLITATDATGSASRLDAGIEIRLAPGWHTYWRDPGDAGIAPKVSWAGSQNLQATALSWPAPQRYALQGFESAAYESRVVLPVAVTLARPGKPLLLHATLDYAACAEICVPYRAVLSLALPAGLAAPGPQAPLIARYAARVPVSAKRAGIVLHRATVARGRHGTVLQLRLASIGSAFVAPDLFVEGLKSGSFGRPEVTLADQGRRALLRVPVRRASPQAVIGKRLTLTLVDGRRAAQLSATPVAGSLVPAGTSGLLAILGVALLGGLILNVMPCVLPVLSLKLLAVIGYAGAERRRMRVGFLATALGILVSFAVLAGALIGLREAGIAIGWGIQFQQPWFLAAMVAVVSLFAANLWDWFAIGVPVVVDRGGVLALRHPAAAAFVTGIFATLLATPCSAPFVGTAIGFALARGPREILGVFLIMGLGFALPYLAVALIPGIARLLPRPGRWMLRLRHVLGFALTGTAIWLLSVLAEDVGMAASITIGGLMAALLGALAWRHRIDRDARRSRRALGAAAAALCLAALAVPSLTPPQPAAAALGAADSTWRPFNQAALHRLVAQGRVVFVDVSADWCLTCKLNKAAVIDRNPVAARLAAPGVVAMRGDWTRPNPAITSYLEGVGRYGIPFDAVYGPGAPNGIVLPELLTTGAVLHALETADGAKSAERR